MQPMLNNGASPNTVEDFWDLVDMSGGDGACWPFMGNRSPTGYGRFSLNGRAWRSNRLAYVLTKGPLKHWALHTCDNPPCCNPKHLYDGTPFQNARDRVARQRVPDLAGENNPRAKLTLEQVQTMRETYAKGGISYKQLGEMFGICGASACNIVRGKKWKY